MYKDFYGISESPFSIVPSARFLYLSERHREALTHMLASLGGGGGFGLLTGEVGTGKTTVLRGLVARLPQETQVAVILNPSLSTRELLAGLSDELGISYHEQDSIKQLTDGIYQHLLANHQAGKQTLLLVDEAQHLMPDALEQLRLLTNLETDSTKLLKVVLVGQPELQQLLQQENLRQLAQRITSRYHLLPLNEQEVSEYVNYRLRAVDCLHQVFTPALNLQIARATGGIPRLINLVCDKAMLYGFQSMRHQLDKDIVARACDEVLSWQLPRRQPEKKARTVTISAFPVSVLAAGVVVALGIGWWKGWIDLPTRPSDRPVQATPVATTAPAAQQGSERLAPVLAPDVVDSAAEQVAQQSTAQTQEPTIVVQAPLDPVQNWRYTVLQAQSEQKAMQTLYRLWGYDPAVSLASCDSSGRIGLSCYDGKGGLSALREVNRPAVVALREPDGAQYYAAVYAVRDDKVELLLGGERIAVDPSWLDARWDGRYTLLWRPPLGDSASIRYGQQGQRVIWLDHQLSTLLGELPDSQDTFGQALLDKLRRFQREQRLSVDGIAGPQTLMMIDTALHLPGPTLQPENS